MSPCPCGAGCNYRRRLSHIYFVRARISGLVKIGITTDPHGRIRGLDTATPGGVTVLAVALGEREHESALHRIFASTRVNGEWFEMSHDLERHIERLAECDPHDRERFLIQPWAVPLTRRETAEMFRRIHQNLIKEKAA